MPSSASALKFNTHIDFCLGQHVEAKEKRSFAVRTWRLQAWERGSPPRRVEEAHQSHLRCAKSQAHRKAIARFWTKRRAEFYARRKRKLAERERLRYLPFDCGSTRSAIRCDIMWCESGGSYVAENPSGAFGRYQLMPEWWSHLGRKPTPSEQDRLASELWAGGSGRSNWVC